MTKGCEERNAVDVLKLSVAMQFCRFSGDEGDMVVLLGISMLLPLRREYP
jgi:hypothetical protein